MTTQNTDQIEEIKKAEENMKKELEQAMIDQNTELREVENKLEKQNEEFEASIVTHNQDKLEQARKLATKTKELKVFEAESVKNKIISDAKDKEGDALKHVVANFMEHINA